MRKIVLLFILAASASLLQAQSVGIGTTTPNANAQLDVVSTTKGLLIPRMTGAQRNAIASPVAGLMVYQTNTVLTLPTSGPGFYVHSGTDWKLMARAENNSWTISGNDQFSNVSGFVGIGVSNPSAKLHVDGAIRAEGSLLLYNGPVYMTNTTDNQTWLMNYFTSNGGHLSFVDLGVSRLSLKNGGNIGINNTDPLTKLHIEGGQDAGLTSTSNGYIMLGTNTSGSNLLIDNNEIMVRTGFSTAGTLSLQNNGGEISIGARTTINKDGEALRFDGNNPTMKFYQNGAYKATIGLTSAADLTLTTTGGAILLSPIGASVMLNPSSGGNVLISPSGGGDVIVNPGTGGYIQLNPTGGGNVAIGNITSTSSGYKLAVTGKIICEEVKVKLSTAWPDYVFNEDYKLPALSDIEKFIQQNKRLPNIPSASEVAKNGIEVGDIQKRMMEKIEELTLYIIDMQKQIDSLKKGIK